MKPEIHPKYTKVTVNCANCGTSFETRSTRNNIKVDICSNCHPYYTGKQVLVDTAGRVERFKKRFAKATSQANSAE
ncbi:MAG TPA: 50S ribosomal protein L31 [Chlorobaculum sp.]|nr:50S ribosomal protein L31 [Chlorobaculum sp.]